MDNNINDLPLINKIEVGENAEPIIVQVPADKIVKTQKRSPKTQNLDFVESTTVKSIGKQITMTNVLGINQPDDDTISKKQKFFKTLFTIIFISLVVIVLAFTAYSDFSGQGSNAFPSVAELRAILSKSWKFLLFAFISLSFCILFKGAK